jgi:glycosyltransferase involved in cell wall biosynthesis
MLVSAIIPTKNEREAISEVIEATKQALDGYSYEIIVVDNSSDETPNLAAQAGVQVVRQTRRGGVGAGLWEGFSHSRGEVVVTMDGDGSYDPADIPRVIKPILTDEADFVNGDRLSGERVPGSIAFVNLLGNRILTWVGNVCFGAHVWDSQSGMKAIRREYLNWMSLFESGFPTISELIGEAVRTRARIMEVPITYSRRKGKTKLSPATDGIRIFFATILLMRDYNPLLLFGGIGLLLILMGALTSLPVAEEYFTLGTFTFVGRALVSSTLTISGFVCILVGIILNSWNFSMRRLEARILGLGIPHTHSRLEESREPESDVARRQAVVVAESHQPTQEDVETLEKISVRRAVAGVLREANYSVRSPGMIRGASGIGYDFDILASRNDEMWVFDVSADDASSDSNIVLSLFAKVLDVKPKKATLLAMPTITPEAGELARMYNIQVLVGNSSAQLCDVIRLVVGTPPPRGEKYEDKLKID